MTLFETITLVISLSALGISICNYRRISHIDEKEEYKSKRSLFHDAYEEAKSLINRIETDVNSINGKRMNLFTFKSPYIGSLGCRKGHEAILENIRTTNTIKEELSGFCEELKDITKKDDKVAFDRCMEIRVALKDRSVEISKALGDAQNTINNMFSMAEAQRENV